PCYSHHRGLHSFPTRRSSDLHLLEPLTDLVEAAPSGDRAAVALENTVRIEVLRLGDRHDARVDDREPELVEHGRRTHERVQLLRDRKSTRLNSSHVKISYAVF